ncbi:MAG: FAD-dependent monooxygenase [Arenicella sp.]
MTIAILGGGIGGLSAAIALKQEGFTVLVYERHPAPTEIGAGIVCWPNASFVLDQLGLLEQVKQVSGNVNAMSRFSHKDELLGHLDITQLDKQMGYPSLSIIRKDLMKILSDRSLELGIPIHYRHELVSINHNASNKTRVHFSNGKQIHADIIIGADGRMNSVARQYVNRHNQPVYQGFINWIGVLNTTENLFTEPTIADYWGVGERFGIVPVSPDKAYWAGGSACPDIGTRDKKHYKKELHTLFDSWPYPIARIIDETATSKINKIYVHDHDPIQCWHRDNVVLLGDAAHSPLPTSGQGACQALEDSWHLANCIKAGGENITKAFNDYTQIRLKKTTDITIGGRQLAKSIFNTDPEFCLQRNINSQNTDYKASVHAMAQGWAVDLPIALT